MQSEDIIDDTVKLLVSKIDKLQEKESEESLEETGDDQNIIDVVGTKVNDGGFSELKPTSSSTSDTDIFIDLNNDGINDLSYAKTLKKNTGTDDDASSSGIFKIGDVSDGDSVIIEYK